MEHAIVMAVERTVLASDTPADDRRDTGVRVLSPCLADQRSSEEPVPETPFETMQLHAEEETP
jgi:hypothetical protein